MLKEKFQCKVPECNNLSRANTTNGRFTKELCEEHYNKTFERECNNCHKTFTLKAITYVHSLEYNWICQNCHRIENAKKYRGSKKQKEHLKKLNPGKILKDYYKDPKNKEAIKEKMLIHNRSEKMIEISKKNAVNLENYRNSEEFKEHIKYHNSSKFCKKCNQITKHVGNRCCICDPIENCSPNFIIKENVLCYKGIPWTQLCKDFDNGVKNYKDYPGLDKRLNKNGEYIYTYYKIDPITNKKILLNKNNFFSIKDILYYKNIPWEEYKKNFKSQNIDNHDFDSYNGFYQKTYRLSGLDTTGQDAMEQELVEKGVKWFVYIKFYKRNRKTFPLSCGQSASKLINKSGSDINFGYKETSASRKFLVEEGLLWIHDQIYIIPCDSKDEANKLEIEIQEKFNLFG